MLFFLLAAAAAAFAAPLDVAVDCTPGLLADLPPFFRSVGYTPATHALRADELENTLHIGAVPRRGVTQVRIHYLLDLVTVLGFTPSNGTASGWQLQYLWDGLDFALDWLVANNLSPGFELMGSPAGFPALPAAFYSPYNGNGHIYPNQTLPMFRALVGDLLQRYIARYGKQEVQSWKIESWNEPDQGWGFPKIQNSSDPVLTAYTAYWDACAAGIEDAEAATGARLTFGGTASGRAAGDAYFLPAMLNHRASGGRNSLTGAPVRWDYISAHVKGASTSYVTVQGEWAVSALLRSNAAWRDPAAGLLALPVSNDEGDPMVGWEKPEPWRGDARYAAIIPKMVAQHATAIADNATGGGGLNPLGLLSFDGAFMNGVDDTYTGFGLRTMTARFGGPAPGDASPTAFVRKNGLAAFALLARLPGPARCSVRLSGAGAGSAGVLYDAPGALAGVDAAAGEAGVLVYNSPDCADPSGGAGSGGVVPAITLSGLPFDAARVAAGGCLAVPYWVDDAPERSPAAAWAAAGSPPLPSPALLKALWATAAAMGAPAGAPVPLALAPCGAAPGAGFCATLPAPNVTLAPPPRGELPLPGLLLWHIALPPLGPRAPPPPPAAPVAYAKAPAASFLQAGVEVEVALRWDCSRAPRTVLAYVIQYSATGGGGGNASWATVNAPPYPADALCAFTHAAPASAPGPRAYRVAAVDYWGSQSEWSASAVAQAWPAPP